MAENGRVRWRASLQQVGQAQRLQSLPDLLPLLYAQLSSASGEIAPSDAGSDQPGQQQDRL